MFLTVGTYKEGNTDITTASSGSNFPVGFHPDVLFSGRAFPYHTSSGNVYGEE